MTGDQEPAFKTSTKTLSLGFDLVDVFAAIVLWRNLERSSDKTVPEHLAACCYEVAGAMMKERERRAAM